MIDAGESEENIATVIRFQKSQREPSMSAAAPGTAVPPGQTPPSEVDAHGNRITRNSDGSVKFMQGPEFSGNAETSPDRNVATIGGFGVAPEDLLGVPSLVAGAKAIGRGVSNLAGRVTPDALRRGAEIVGSPWKEGTKAILNKGAEMLERRAAPAASEAVAPVAKVAVGNPSIAMTAAREAFAKAGVKPLPAEASNVMELIRRGKAPEEALAVVLKNRPVDLIPKAPYEVAIQGAKDAAVKAGNVMAQNVRLTAEEVKFGQSLLARGKTEKEAMDAIMAQRAFRTIPGTMSDAEARAALDLRNARGQIKTPSAQTAAERYPR